MKKFPDKPDWAERLQRTFKSKYENGWNDGFELGSQAMHRLIISMLERELYKNKGEDVYYEHAIKSVVKKIKDMKHD